jgi:hypothetical protein
MEKINCKGMRTACEKQLWLRQRAGAVAPGLTVASYETTRLEGNPLGVNVHVVLSDGSAFDAQFELNR